ncbi:MAG: hypothetical protein RLY66_490 [Candidatus Parcubacteria bacterium]|jgi:hypothetical protein
METQTSSTGSVVAKTPKPVRVHTAPANAMSILGVPFGTVPATHADLADSRDRRESATTQNNRHRI